MASLNQSLLRIRNLSLGKMRLLLCLGLLCPLQLSCQSPPGPFVRLNVEGLQPQARKVHLKLTMGTLTTETDFMGEDSYSKITLDFARGVKGTLLAELSAFTDNGCNLANGSGELDISEDVIYELPVSLIPEPADKCGLNGVRLTVMKLNMGTSSGTVTSTPLTINCGQVCTYTYLPGTMLTLTATPSPGSKLVSWTGGACSGTQPCGFTLDANTTIVATFGECKGWCPENPAQETNTLHAIWGTDAFNMFAVGDGGRILGGNGMTWTRMNSGTTVPLRVVGANKSGTVVAAGDSGAVRVLTGGNWTAMSGTNSLRIVAALPS